MNGAAALFAIALLAQTPVQPPAPAPPSADEEAVRAAVQQY